MKSLAGGMAVGRSLWSRWTALTGRRCLGASVAVVLALALIPAAVPRARSTRPMFTDIAPPGMADPRVVSDGACFADVYGDGREDLFVPNMVGPSHLWRNDGGGHFTDITTTSGIAVVNATSCAFVDFNGDGLPDLYVTSRSRATASAYIDEESKLFRNDGGGHFTDVTAAAGVGLPGRRVLSSDWADYKGNGLYAGYVPARSGPPTVTSRAARAFSCRTASGSKSRSIRVLSLDTVSSVFEYTTLSAARQISAKSCAAAG